MTYLRAWNCIPNHDNRFGTHMEALGMMRRKFSPPFPISLYGLQAFVWPSGQFWNFHPLPSMKCVCIVWSVASLPSQDIKPSTFLESFNTPLLFKHLEYNRNPDEWVYTKVCFVVRYRWLVHDGSCMHNMAPHICSASVIIYLTDSKEITMSCDCYNWKQSDSADNYRGENFDDSVMPWTSRWCIICLVAAIIWVFCETWNMTIIWMKKAHVLSNITTSHPGHQQRFFRCGNVCDI